MRVYLAGGMKSSWRDRVRECVNADWLDPCSHGLPDPAMYTLWDLMAVKQSDVVFAYFEKENPSGFGLVLELGYAKGLGLTTILVNETGDRRLAIVNNAVDFMCESLEDGIRLLSSISKIPKRMENPLHPFCPAL